MKQILLFRHELAADLMLLLIGKSQAARSIFPFGATAPVSQYCRCSLTSTTDVVALVRSMTDRPAVSKAKY